MRGPAAIDDPNAGDAYDDCTEVDLSLAASYRMLGDEPESRKRLIRPGNSWEMEDVNGLTRPGRNLPHTAPAWGQPPLDREWLSPSLISGGPELGRP